jgi:hypothetical protein
MAQLESARSGESWQLSEKSCGCPSRRGSLAGRTVIATNVTPERESLEPQVVAIGFGHLAATRAPLLYHLQLRPCISRGQAQLKPDLEHAILDRVTEVVQSPKTWGGALSWRSAPRHRSNSCLELVAAILIGGVSRSGLQVRLNARTDMPDRDVYAQLELGALRSRGIYISSALNGAQSGHTPTPSELQKSFAGGCCRIGTSRILSIESLESPRFCRRLH